MKKIFAILLVVVLLVTVSTVFTACGNMRIGPGNFNYTHVNISTHQKSVCYDIDGWYDNETGIEVDTKEAGSLFLSEGTYILIESEHDCPFCGGN